MNDLFGFWRRETAPVQGSPAEPVRRRSTLPPTCEFLFIVRNETSDQRKTLVPAAQPAGKGTQQKASATHAFQHFQERTDFRWPESIKLPHQVFAPRLDFIAAKERPMKLAEPPKEETKDRTERAERMQEDTEYRVKVERHKEYLKENLAHHFKEEMWLCEVLLKVLSGTQADKLSRDEQRLLRVSYNKRSNSDLPVSPTSTMHNERALGLATSSAAHLASQLSKTLDGSVVDAPLIRIVLQSMKTLGSWADGAGNLNPSTIHHKIGLVLLRLREEEAKICWEIIEDRLQPAALEHNADVIQWRNGFQELWKLLEEAAGIKR
jgi:hypothetical protein